MGNLCSKPVDDEDDTCDSNQFTERSETTKTTAARIAQVGNEESAPLVSNNEILVPNVKQTDNSINSNDDNCIEPDLLTKNLPELCKNLALDEVLVELESSETISHVEAEAIRVRSTSLYLSLFNFLGRKNAIRTKSKITFLGEKERT